MFGNIEETEMVKFECSALETGDVFMTFEDGEQMYVADLVSYYNIPEEYFPFSDDDEEVNGVVTKTGEMPREYYAEICKEYAEWLK